MLCFLVIAVVGCTQTSPSAEIPNRVLLISFDGFRYDYLSKTDTPSFDSLVSQGVQSEGLIPVFPSKTFPNHYSIATGLYPQNSGMIANTMFDEDMGQWYRISDRQAVEDNRWYKGEPIWNTAEMQGRTAGTMFWVGSEADIQNMRPTYWKKFNSSLSHKARIDTVVKWLSYPDSNRVDLATLYFENVDKAGHDYGLDSDSLRQAIVHSDTLIGYLKEELQQQKLWERTNIIIVSDHGMVDLSANKIIELDKIIDLDDLERIIWAPVTMMQPKSGKKQAIYDSLKKQENNYRIFKKEELPDRYHIKESPRLPELIMVADAGYTILNQAYKSRFISSLPSATHGYDPALKEMEALFLARGPAFRKGVTVPSFKNIHLYELMAHLLGLQPAVNDGSMDSVKVMLK